MYNVLLYPIILAGGVLQAVGAPINAQLRASLTNPWLATLVSFLIVTVVFVVVAAMLPTPLPTGRGLATMPWWAPTGGLAGALAVVAGLLFVQRVGAGPYAALTIGANLVTSVLIDQFGLVNMPVHTIGLWRAIGVILMVVGVGLIARY